MRPSFRVFAASLLSLAATVPAHAAELTPGPYLGLFVGGSFINTDARIASGQKFAFDDSAAAYGATGGILAPLGNGAFGIEGNVTVESGEASRTLRFDDGGGATVDVETEVVYDYGYGVSALYGGFIGPLLVYLRGGYQWLRIVERASGAEGSQSDTELLDGPRAGIGLAVPLYRERVSLRLDYHHTFYQKEGGLDIGQDQITAGLALVF